MRRSSGDPGAKKTIPGAQLGRAVWAQTKTDYVTGNESLSQIADRLGVTKSAVEKHASQRHRDSDGIGWDQARAEFLRRKNGAAETQGVKSGAHTLSELRESLSTVSMLACEKIKGFLEDPDAKIEIKDLVSMAKLSAILRVELAGDPDPDGAPIRVDDSLRNKLDRLTVDQLKKIARGEYEIRVAEVPADCTETNTLQLQTESGI
jgi:hypothetical protein